MFRSKLGPGSRLLSSSCHTFYGRPFRMSFASTSSKTYWDILGVSPGTPAGEVKRTYYEKLKKYHPDICEDENANEVTASLNEAFKRYMKDNQSHKTSCTAYDPHALNTKVLNQIVSFLKIDDRQIRYFQLIPVLPDLQKLQVIGFHADRKTYLDMLREAGITVHYDPREARYHINESLEAISDKLDAAMQHVEQIRKNCGRW